MSKISYLLGAGASADVLPVVKNMPERIQEFIARISNSTWAMSTDEKFEGFDDDKKVGTIEEVRQEFIESLKWLYAESKNHASIDTFAKKLYIRREHENFLKLKAVLTGFFYMEQMYHTADKRYDTFIAALFDSKGQLPGNVRILSWNYDFQFELAMSLYLTYPFMSACREKLNMFPSNECEDKECFTVFKLNGTTAVENRHIGSIYDPITDVHKKYDKDLLKEILNMYAVVSRNTAISLLNFAWEVNAKGSTNSIIHETALQHTMNTEVLVVVGYSFPYFNRERDKKIISNMSNLKRVYIQDPDSENRLKSFQAVYPDVNKLKFELINETEQFFIPYEL